MSRYTIRELEHQHFEFDIIDNKRGDAEIAYCNTRKNAKLLINALNAWDKKSERGEKPSPDGWVESDRICPRCNIMVWRRRKRIWYECSCGWHGDQVILTINELDDWDGVIAHREGVKAGHDWYASGDDYPEPPYEAADLIDAWKKGFHDGSGDAEMLEWG